MAPVRLCKCLPYKDLSGSCWYGTFSSYTELGKSNYIRRVVKTDALMTFLSNMITLKFPSSVLRASSDYWISWIYLIKYFERKLLNISKGIQMVHSPKCYEYAFLCPFLNFTTQLFFACLLVQLDHLVYFT
jgi:hypothetical protein